MAYEERIEFDKFLTAKEFFDYSHPQVMQPSKSSILSVRNEENSTIGLSDYLVEFSRQSQSYCVGCVDMVNSTKISASISPQKLSGYYEVFLNSMSKIIGKFGGQVIKNVGDCLLYYFPNPSESKNKGFVNCLDCGLAMVDARKIICEQLELQKLPSLSYRISADWGSVLVMNTTDSPAVDLIGPPVNMCTKINHCAISNEFVIGGDLYEVVKKFAKYSFQQVQSCNVGFKHSYPVYKVCQEF